MRAVSEVAVRPIEPRRLEPFIGHERVDALIDAATTLRRLLQARRIVNVNSTATGGGVAEMLTTLLGYVRGIGLDAHWAVITGDPEFFSVTKRIHNGLYGSPGDGGDLGDQEHAIYDRTIASNVELITAEIREGDVVIVARPPARRPHPTARGIWRACRLALPRRLRRSE